jgi:hypothetical protein
VGARHPLAGSFGPIVARRFVERHRATWILLEVLLYYRELAKWRPDQSYSRSRMMEKIASCLSMEWIEICLFDGKVGLFCREEQNGSRRTE